MMGKRRENVEIDYARIESRIRERKIKLLMQTRTILDGLTEKFSNRVPFAEFENSFNSRTKTNFQQRFLKLQKYMVKWELADFFQDVPHGSVVHMLFEDNDGAKFIITSNVAGTEEYVKKDKPHTCLAVAQSKATIRMNSWAYAQQEAVMFSPPSWPFLSSDLKNEYQLNYKRCLLSNSINYNECQKLAYQWWGPQIKKLSQILLILKKLSTNLHHTDYFLLTKLDETLLNVFPNEWKRNCSNPTINYDSFGLTKSKMLELNLIVRFDIDDPNKFCVNELINYLNFEIIHDEVASYIYDYADKHNHIYVADLDPMLCMNIETWDRGSKKVRIMDIQKTIRKFDNLFDVRGESLQTKRSRTMFFVPLHFSPFNN